MWTIFFGELVGTFVLMLMGNAVSANVSFKGNKGTTAGYFCCITGWALAVFLGVASALAIGCDGHINPAITAMFLVAGDISFATALVCVAAQFIGAMAAQILVNAYYWQTLKTSDPETILGMHSTIPTHKQAWWSNMLSEYVATLVLAFVVLFVIVPNTESWGIWLSLVVAVLILSIGLSLGGTTGFAINPARDLGPRVVYWVMFVALPKIKALNYPTLMTANKKNQAFNPQWNYSWVPVVMPVLGGVTVGVFAYV